MKSLFIVPVWNQIQELPRLIEEFRSTDLPCDTLLFVNNGSDDGSERLMRESGFEVLELPRNMGVGGADIAGAEWGLDRGYDVYGTIAGNGKMLASEMHRVLDPVLEKRSDFVTGSRFMGDGSSPNLPRFRQAAIPAVSRFVQLVTGAYITDATCGYHAMRLDILRRARFDWRAEWLKGYAWEYYIYAKVVLSKQWRWMEVPITMRYPPKGQRYSKIKPVLNWYPMLKPWVTARIDGEGYFR